MNPVPLLHGPHNKKHGFLAVTIVTLIIILLLLWFRNGNKRSGLVVQQKTGYTPAGGTLNNYGVDYGSFNYQGGSFNIPGLVINGSRDMHIIGSCSSDCASRKSKFIDPYNGPTYVFNQAGRAATNYYGATSPAQSCAWYQYQAGDGSCVNRWAAG